jgi:polyisoprenoid-binding protein YceI
MTYTALLLTALLAQTSADTTYYVDTHKSTLRYGIVHKFHKVHAESKLVQGKAALKPDGSLQVMIRAPVGSFESGDGNRDEHMRETMEEPKYPYVTYKGVAKLAGGVLPSKLDLVLDGQLDFHGRKQAEKVPVHIDNAGPTGAHATGHFVVSLDRYQVERPSLLLIKIDDACAIDFDLQLTSGGH